MAFKRKQAGVLMVEMSLALLISALAAVGIMREQIRVETMRSADIEADTLEIYRLALQRYTDDYYQDIQINTSPITRGTQTLAPGAAAGQTLQPTVANLIGMGYLPNGFINQTIMVDGGTYENRILREPAGCVATACNVNGFAYVSVPYNVRGAAEVNGPVVGQMLNRLGGQAGVSVPGAAANITGAGSAWGGPLDIPNPVAGAPAGVVGIRFGYGSNSLLSYVRIQDVRDPNLLGNLTVAGNVSAGGTLNATGATTLTTLTTSGATTINGAATVNNTLAVTGAVTGQADITSRTNVGTSDGIAACLRTALTSSGNIIARSAACLDRITLNSTAGTVEMRDNANVSRVRMTADTGNLALFNGGAGQTVLLDSVAGRVQSNVGNFSTSALAGSSCAAFIAGDIAQDSAASGTLLICRGGLWRRTGLEQAVRGTPCPTIGVLAQSSTNEALICRGTWETLNDRVSASVTMALWSGNGAATGASAVPVPSCGVGGVPDISVSALQTGADYGGVPPRNRFEIQVLNSGPWDVIPVLVDLSGAAHSDSFTNGPYNFGWTATTYCQYPA